MSDLSLRVGASFGPPLTLKGPSEISIAGGRIASIKPISLEPTDPACHLVALPAPVDAHDHGRGLRTVAFGAADDTLETWLAALPLEPKVDPYLRAATAFARMAEGGVCAANHCHNTQDPARLAEEAEAVSRAARDVGIRIAFAVPIMDRNPIVYGDLGLLADRLPIEKRGLVAGRDPRWRSAEAALALVDTIAAYEHDLFAVHYCPVGPQWVCDETLAAVAAASAATGRRVHMHLFETERQRQWADAHYPLGLVRHFDAIGLLSPRLTIAHGVWLRPDECALLAERGVVVSVNTSSNLRLRSGIAPVGRFVAAGMRFGIGLDGMAFDDDEDMLREMRLLFALQRGFGGAEILDQARLFQAACVDGRRTIVADDGGSIVEGAPADVLVLDLAAMGRDALVAAVSDPGYKGAGDVLDLILTRATKRHVHRLIVAGRSIVEDGRLVSVDLPALEAALLAEARRHFIGSPERKADIGLLQEAIRSFYRCGCHRERRS